MNAFVDGGVDGGQRNKQQSETRQLVVYLCSLDNFQPVRLLFADRRRNKGKPCRVEIRARSRKEGGVNSHRRSHTSMVPNRDYHSFDVVHNPCAPLFCASFFLSTPSALAPCPLLRKIIQHSPAQTASDLRNIGRSRSSSSACQISSVMTPKSCQDFHEQSEEKIEMVVSDG